MYEVTAKKKVLKNLERLPDEVKALFRALVVDLREEGPVQPTWGNYSKLGRNQYHCHLNYSYVACWLCEKNSISIEVYYVGSREGAPY